MKFSFEPLYDWFLTHGLRIVFIGISWLVLLKISRRLINRFEEKLCKGQEEDRRKRIQTLGRILMNTAAVTVGIVFGLIILKEFGLDIGPILAGAGILGLAIGFGAQNLVKNVLSGLFILLENHFRVGDVIKAGKVSGLVESISLRVTTLRDIEGKVHIIPNGDIGVVSNMTKEWSRAVLDIGIAYKEDPDYAMEVIKKVGMEMMGDEEYKKLLLEPVEVLGVNAFNESAVVIRAMIKTPPLRQRQVAREFSRRLKKVFDSENIVLRHFSPVE
ncbi:mechanosensitive ion channel protein MscS [bacterium (candidate division B38) B3_B38]|nr:MAG: mechanosensitive ion channel protein MscS [bacterium (candidate division B38) B3_B38]